MIKLYDFPLSGHAHRVRLMLSLLKIEHEIIHVKLDKGEQFEPFFTEINPFQQVPVLDDNGFIVSDSVAILVYLAKKYAADWFPQDAQSSARIQEWLAIAGKEISQGPANARLVNVFHAELDHADAIEQSHKLLARMDAHLANRNWLATDKVSIADIAAYTYIAHAPEGDVSLESYTNILNWLKKIEALENFIPMDKTSVGLCKV